MVAENSILNIFSILNVNPTIGTMKAPEHLVNTTEVTTCKNGVETSRQKSKWPYIM